MWCLAKSCDLKRPNSRKSINLLHKSALHAPLVVLIALVVILFEIDPVLAHKVNVFAYVDIDKLTVEGYFSGKAVAVDCPVELFDGQGRKLMEGRTDDKGTWSVKLADLPPIKGDLVVVLAAGSGHRAEYTLPSADLASPLMAVQRLEAGDPAKQDRSICQASAPADSASSAGLTALPQSPTSLTAVSGEALFARLDRLEAMLSAQQKVLMEQKIKGPSMTEIIGGIGWIFGIVGVAAYFMSRKRTTGTDGV